MNASTAARLAADIGGTFTDVALAVGERLYTAKVLTTHEAPATGVLRGIRRVLQDAELDPAQVAVFVHGTTLAANAIIERRGARTALIATHGHRDALETGYENRFDQYDISLMKPPPLVPRHLRWSVTERISAQGRVLKALEEQSVRALIEPLRENAIESVAIGFLHSYANPAHEQRVAAILQDALPDLWITLSSDVSPEIREYDRLSTATANAYVQPLMAGYLRDLERQLAGDGFNCPLLLVMSTGGLTTVDAAVRYPVRLVESGPAGGAILAAEIARQSGFDEVVAFDMGGTTAKLCLIDQGRPQRSGSFEVDRMHRFIRGSGLPLRIPTIEMIEIGAGGGSIASVDDLTRLRIGPRSAGSTPGPACYGRGGEHATVTDGDLVLGKLDSKGFAAGLFDLRIDLAQAAIARDVGEPLGVDVAAAAAAMAEVVDEAMANAARVHAVESGKDISNRTLIAFGGAAPLHAARVAEKLGISRVVIPANAAVGCAVGFLLAPISFEVSRSWLIGLDEIERSEVEAVLSDMRAAAAATVRQAAGDVQLQTEVIAHMRYAAQGHEVEAQLADVPTPDGAAFRAAFEERYVALYGRLIPKVPVNLVTLTIRVSAVRPAATAKATSKVAASVVGQRGPDRLVSKARGAGTISVPTYARHAMPAGTALQGPIIVTEAQTTTIVPEGSKVIVDEWGHLVLERESRQ